MWSWGDEILVGFSQTYYKQRTPDHHQVDADKPEEPRLARSLDGGRTWTIEAPPGLIPPEQGGKQPIPLDRPMDFFATRLRHDTPVQGHQQGASRLWFSNDKGKTWNGPFDFPLFGFTGVAARTDYIVRGKREALVFLTAAKNNGREGRPFCARTTDGGMTWERLGFMGDERRASRSCLPPCCSQKASCSLRFGSKAIPIPGLTPIGHPMEARLGERPSESPTRAHSVAILPA